MPRDILAESVAWLHQFRAKNLVEPVTYMRGTASFTVDATPALEESTLANDVGVFMNTRRQDFLINLHELMRNGIDEPERGDLIVRQVDHLEVTYEVCSDGDEPVWRPMSRYWTDVRIHAIRINTEVTTLVSAASQIDATVGSLQFSEE